MPNNLNNTNPAITDVNNNEDFDFSIDESSKDEKKHTVHVTNTQAHNPTSTQTNVQPQIPGDTAPFIVLCGPPTSGKSMILKSLATYLYNNKALGYSITANTTLLNTAKYQDECKLFNDMISQGDTAMPNTVDYLLADIMTETGNVVAHFLEAPGEDFFSLDNSEQEPNIPFKGYLEKVAQTTIGKNRRVIYVILLDLDSPTSFRNDNFLRDKYEKKMKYLYNRFVLNHPSRVILLYNKVDIAKNGLWANVNGCFNFKAVFEDAKQNYPHLFFKKKFLFWDVDNYKFLPFCTGSFPREGGYIASGPAYPSALWKEITKILW